MATAHGARTGAVWGAGLLEANQPKILGELETGYNTSQQQLGQGFGEARDAFGNLVSAGQPGLDRYAALTTGSPESMQASLEGTPGYQFALGQSLDALNRRRAAGGMLNSGNADADAIALGSGLASQTLTQERQALQPLLGMYQQGQTGLAQTGIGYGTAGAGLTSDYYTGRANVLDDTNKSIIGLGTQALAAGDQAKSQNQANMLNAGIGLAKGFASLGSGSFGGAAGAAGAAGGTGGMPGNMGFMRIFAGT